MKRTKKLIAMLMASLMLMAMMMIVMAAEAKAGTRYATCLEDLDNANEVVLISAKYSPAGQKYAVCPDTREKYTNWLTIEPYNPDTAAEKHQVWNISREGNVSHGYGYHWERIGTWTITNRGAYNPSNGRSPLMSITYTKQGFYWMPEIYGEYDDDGVVYEHINDLSQRFDIKIVGKKDGAAVFDIKSVGGKCSVCSGGYSTYIIEIKN